MTPQIPASPPPYRDKVIVKIAVTDEDGKEMVYDVTGEALLSEAWVRWMAQQQKINEQLGVAQGFVVVGKEAISNGSPLAATPGLQVWFDDVALTARIWSIGPGPSYQALELNADTVQVLATRHGVLGPGDPFMEMRAGTFTCFLFGDFEVLGNVYPAADDLNDLGLDVNRWRKLYARTARIDNLQVFANNAAALVGGLVAGDLYRTATGVVMVTF